MTHRAGAFTDLFEAALVGYYQATDARPSTKAAFVLLVAAALDALVIIVAFTGEPPIMAMYHSLLLTAGILFVGILVIMKIYAKAANWDKATRAIAASFNASNIQQLRRETAGNAEKLVLALKESKMSAEDYVELFAANQAVRTRVEDEAGKQQEEDVGPALQELILETSRIRKRMREISD